MSRLAKKGKRIAKIAGKLGFKNRQKIGCELHIDPKTTHPRKLFGYRQKNKTGTPANFFLFAVVGIPSIVVGLPKFCVYGIFRHAGAIGNYIFVSAYVVLLGLI